MSQFKVQRSVEYSDIKLDDKPLCYNVMIFKLCQIQTIHVDITTLSTHWNISNLQKATVKET